VCTPLLQTLAVLGGAGSRLLAVLTALPRSLLPHLVPVGRQVILPASAAAQLTHTAANAGAGAGRRPPPPPPPHDPLAPSRVTGRLAAHRMISYRLRIAGLYTAPA
jgi:hypothetical protein